MLIVMMRLILMGMLVQMLMLMIILMMLNAYPNDDADANADVKRRGSG